MDGAKDRKTDVKIGDRDLRCFRDLPGHSRRDWEPLALNPANGLAQFELTSARPPQRFRDGRLIGGEGSLQRRDSLRIGYAGFRSMCQQHFHRLNLPLQRRQHQSRAALRVAGVDINGLSEQPLQFRHVARSGCPSQRFAWPCLERHRGRSGCCHGTSGGCSRWRLSARFAHRHFLHRLSGGHALRGCSVLLRATVSSTNNFLVQRRRGTLRPGTRRGCLRLQSSCVCGFEALGFRRTHLRRRSSLRGRSRWQR
jgi:hypothetical protein